MNVNEKQGIFYYSKGSEIKEDMYNIVLLSDGSMHYLYEYLSEEMSVIKDIQMIKFVVPTDSIVLSNNSYQIGLMDNHKDKRDVLIDISRVITQNVNHPDK